MFRVLLLGMLVATIPFLIYSGMRRRLAYAISVTATIYLIVIGLRVLTGFWWFREELQNTIGAIGVIVLVASAVYMAMRHYGERTVRRKLAEREQSPDAHRSLIDNLRRTLRE
ncbi:MAG: hypothetical protein F4Y02_08440 [Chloroflexi bacterium]|nr:hypothetical protein [Chloroflexota bacterium]